MHLYHKKQDWGCTFIESVAQLWNKSIVQKQVLERNDVHTQPSTIRTATRTLLTSNKTPTDHTEIRVYIGLTTFHTYWREFGIDLHMIGQL